MDPNALLRNITECLEELDWEGARQGIECLQNWLNNGGFAPDWGKYPYAVDYIRTFHFDQIHVPKRHY